MGANNFSEFIATKGVKSLEFVTGTPANTIYSWTRRDLIPRKVWPELMRGYPDVTLAHLMLWESASKPQAD